MQDQRAGGEGSARQWFAVLALTPENSDLWGEDMGGSLSPISGAHTRILHRAMAALRPRIDPLRAADVLRPLHLRLRVRADINKFGDHLLLSPAALVEIRALEVTGGDVIRSGAAAAGPNEPQHTPRLWPFRWPAADPPILTPSPRPEPQPLPGLYLDILF